MKFTLGLAAALVLVNDASAHYIFNQITVGTKKFGVYENIRKNTNFNSPITGMNFLSHRAYHKENDLSHANKQILLPRT
jgi:hypothetical protein